MERELINQENGERFSIGHPVGDAFHHGRLPVYTATWISNDSNSAQLRVAIKCVNMVTQRDIYDTLKTEEESCNAVASRESTQIGIIQSFRSGNLHCVVFPYMECSLRLLLAQKFPNGMKEKYICQVIHWFMRYLSHIHGCGRIHGEISAGHVFLYRNSIRLSYAATAYDFAPNQDQVLSRFMPVEQVTHWAAAPELYETGQKTREGDVWLIGIMALELAYGGLRFTNREELLQKITEINRTKKLPARKFQEDGDQGDQNKIKKKKFAAFGWFGSKKWGFSKAFESMVVQCLDMESAKRPTPAQLDGFEVLEKARRRQISIFKHQF